MIRFALSLVVVLMLSVPAIAQNSQLPAVVNQAAYYSMVRISNTAGGGGRFWGSGTHLNDGMIVTCAHLFREGGREVVGNIEVHFIDGHASAAKLLSIDHPWDLALLKLESPPAYQGTSLVSETPKAGDRTYHGGFGGSGQPVLQHGTIRDFHTYTAGASRDWLETTGSVRQGDSGGPIYAADGRLIGVLWGADAATTSGTQAGRVQAFLANAQPRYREMGILFNGGFFDRIGGASTCRPGMPCNPGGSVGSGGGGRQISSNGSGQTPVQPPTTTTPETNDTPPAPMPESTATACDETCEQLRCELDDLKKRVDGIAKNRITDDQLADALAGVIAANSERFRGPAGPQGPAGAAGKDATIDMEKLSSLVEQRLPPFYVQVVDVDRNPIGPPSTVSLGGTLHIQHRIIPPGSGYAGSGADANVRLDVSAN
jgi:hypothetical protein